MAEYNESQINSNETERISAERQRINNEAQRQTNETEREAREATRQSNESTRISEYNTFMADAQSEYSSFISNAENAEEGRVQAEASRVSAEQERVTAEQERVTRINEVEATVNDVVDTITPIASDLSSSISEELINENVTSFKAGTSNLSSAILTERMEQSIVSLDNIEGKTEVMESITDPTQRLKNTQIKLLYTLDKDDQVNYFNNSTITYSSDNTTHTFSDGNLKIVSTGGSWCYVTVTIENLNPGCVYCLYVDNVVTTKGASAIDADSKLRGKALSLEYIANVNKPVDSSNEYVFKAINDTVDFYFYCSLDVAGQGDVTYQGITLRKVKEYAYTDITLRSLPTGIKDEIKDGKLIKRVESYRLNGSEDWVIADNSKANTISFACPLPNAVPVNKDVISLNSNKYKTSSDAELYVEDVVSLAIGGLNSSQLLFRVDRGLNTVERLKYHLATAEKDIIIEYAIQPEIYDIDLSITCLPGDIVYINTNRSISCSHRVQLSTKSQVEETQKQIAKSNKSIWEKFKEITEKIKNLTDVEFEIGQNGYIKLPTILGGLLIQWGRTSARFNNEQYKAVIVEYPIPFKTDVYFQTCNMFNACTEAYETNTSIVWDTLLQGKICIYNIRGNMSSDVFVYYVAIGK